ncbi:MAG: glycosyltransferase family 2 protein [Clostridia bacterium]|nr:glycosyltransferase family 2 protein [Clostridia bacterium]
MPKNQIKTDLLLKENAENALISVIVPVYNVSEHIDGCIDSILSQSYGNFELILVDDGTPDISAEKCEEYALKDDRIVVVHKPNGGLSSARNSGMDIATGSFVTFIDSDDYVNKYYLEVMLNFQTLTKADIVQARIHITESKNEDTAALKNEIPYEVADFNKAINSFDFKPAAYAKLYSKSVAENVRFLGWRIHEDDATYYHFAYHAKTICMADVFVYEYFQSQNSITRNSNKDVPLDFIPIYEERIDYFKERDETQLVKGSYFRFCVVLMLNYIGYIKNDTNAQDREKVIKLFRKNYKNGRLKEGPTLYKILMLVFYINPYFATKIMLMLHLR